MVYQDREDAGRKLAPLLRKWQNRHPLVIALPRGGVPVGIEVARALDAPFDILVVKKIGTPFSPELAMGAIAEDGTRVLYRRVIDEYGITEGEIERHSRTKEAEALEKVRTLRGGRPLEDVSGRTVILVDDGLATGMTALAAIRSLRNRGCRELILAVPAAARDSASALRPEVDSLVAAIEEDSFMSVGQYYRDFTQVSDDDVIRMMSELPATRDSPGRKGRHAAPEC